VNDAWPFAESPDAPAFTTTGVVHAGRPILRVAHDASDGTWRFSDGPDLDLHNTVAVGLGEVVAADPSIKELADLPHG
jgi:hypothetical protein